jgi:hypothetical protein
MWEAKYNQATFVSLASAFLCITILSKLQSLALKKPLQNAEA